jgi:hypothetical protein
MSIPDDPFTRDSEGNPITQAEPNEGEGAEVYNRQNHPTLDLGTVSPESSAPMSRPLNAILSTSAPASPRELAHNSPPSSTPGGTLLAPGSAAGAKTPRRVQWTSDSHIVSMHEIEGIDSQTVDPSNLNHLNNALERHRSRTSARRRPPSMLSSAASSVGDESEGEDYDYRLDVDPPSLRQVTSAGSHVDGEPESETLQQLLGNNINEHVTEYIPLGETDGLPNVQNLPSDQTSAAKNLVRAHTGKWGTLRRRVRGAGAVHRTFGKGGDKEKPSADSREKEQDAFAARYPEPESRGDDDEDDYEDRGRPRRYGPMGGSNAMPQVPGGASVLSSLLALYGQQNGGDSGNTSAASSRPTSDDEGDSSDEERRRKAAINSQQNRKGSVFSRLTRDSSPSSTPPDREPLETKPAHMYSTHHRSKSTSSLVDRMDRPPPEPGFMATLKRAKRQLEEADRPKSARSGAGVFGALLQNTAHLSGVATPAASVLTPAARRPGYQLNRFSLPSGDPQVKNKPWRPPSRPSSRSGSRPASVHSSTAVSTGSRDEDSPRDGARLQKTISSYSTDDMLSMKEGKKKTPKTLTLDSLHKLPGAALKEGGHALKSAERWIVSGGKTPLLTPPEKGLTDYFTRPLTEDELRRREREKEKKRRKKARDARKKQEIFVRHP